jgi:hypothetical protein
MQQFKTFTHGSEDSLDHDIYVVVDRPLDNQQAKQLCYLYLPLNANLLVILEGVVTWSYKGTIDECNNSLFSTYSLHKQEFPLPIESNVKRLYSLKMLRTIRGVLSYVSRTDLRVEVKKSLRSSDLFFKVEILESIDLESISDFVKNDVIEVYKFLAFQLGQTIALLEDNVELFTKSEVKSYFPDLSLYLDRKESEPNILQTYLKRFISLVKDSCKEVKKQENLIRTDFFGLKEIMDVKKEILLPPVAVFDLDGTLFEEAWRKEHREKKDYQTYFSLCGQDPIIKVVYDILIDYHNKGYEIWLASGRYEPDALQGTLEALEREKVPYHGIKLRGKGNYVPDYVLKPAWMAKYIGLDRIEVVFEDQQKVIEGFKKKGLNVIDVTQF